MDEKREAQLLKQAQEAAQGIAFAGKPVSLSRYGSGHINDTYLLVCGTESGVSCLPQQKAETRSDDAYADREDCADRGERADRAAGGQRRYILQRMNQSIFSDPVRLMENITGVTAFLRKKIIAAGGDPERETLNVIPAKDGKPYYVDSEGAYWRGYSFVEDTLSFDRSESAADFYQSALGFGRFQCLLADYPAEKLHETIPHFHDTEARYQAFLAAVCADQMGRAEKAAAEINFVMERASLAGELLAMQTAGRLPLRVTHNDTKLNNVLIDAKMKQAVCVIDLDTVMPGLAVNDFGDSIRFGASTAEEDEQNLDKVSCDMELFAAYTRGFLEMCGAALTPAEIEALPLGAKTMTFECGMRFLTDYLQGDTYFRTTRPEQNLDRCRTQFKLVADMEQKWEQMQRIVAEEMCKIKVRNCMESK